MVKYFYRDEEGRIFYLSKEANKVVNDYEKAKKIVKGFLKEKEKGKKK